MALLRGDRAEWPRIGIVCWDGTAARRLAQDGRRMLRVVRAYLFRSERDAMSWIDNVLVVVVVVVVVVAAAAATATATTSRARCRHRRRGTLAQWRIARVSEASKLGNARVDQTTIHRLISNIDVLCATLSVYASSPRHQKCVTKFARVVRTQLSCTGLAP